MPGTVADVLALDSRFRPRDFHQVQWANLALLLTDEAVDDLAVAVRTFVAAGTSAVVCIFDDNLLRGSLVITLDNSGAAVSLSTIDGPASGAAGERTKAAGEVVTWVQTHYGPCSLGFVDKEHAEAFLQASDRPALSAQLQPLVTSSCRRFPRALAIALA